MKHKTPISLFIMGLIVILTTMFFLYSIIVVQYDAFTVKATQSGLSF
jgi:hypothetical protein